MPLPLIIFALSVSIYLASFAGAHAYVQEAYYDKDGKNFRKKPSSWFRLWVLLPLVNSYLSILYLTGAAKKNKDYFKPRD